MTAISKRRLYKLGGGTTVAIAAVLFTLPFILVALFLIEQTAASEKALPPPDAFYQAHRHNEG